VIAGFMYGLMVGSFAGVWIAYFTRGWWLDSEQSQESER
jgi:hypothetical protein